MAEISLHLRFGSKVRLAMFSFLVVGLGGWAAAAVAGGAQQAGAADGKMAQMSGHMAGHMFMTSLRPMKPGDQQKADAVVAAAKTAMAPYQDYRKALADGYEIFLPDVPQPQYHFTRYDYGMQARSQYGPFGDARDEDELEVHRRVRPERSHWISVHVNYSVLRHRMFAVLNDGC
jgi:hypothetical protein